LHDNGINRGREIKKKYMWNGRVVSAKSRERTNKEMMKGFRIKQECRSLGAGAFDIARGIPGVEDSHAGKCGRAQIKT
jgi:hypothetical protein